VSISKKVFINLAIYSSLILCCSCSATRNYDVLKKYSASELREDYDVLRNILESKHPSLYWYTSKDSMDHFFEKYRSDIVDSMTEPQYAWQILLPLVEKIKCGHTSVAMSKGYSRWIKGKKIPSFPLYLKFWNDTMAVIASMNRKDSIFKRGTIIQSINGIDAQEFTKRIFDYLPEDGHATNLNYIRISANFPYYYRNVYGLSKKYAVKYINRQGSSSTDTIPIFDFPKDSTKKDSLSKPARKRITRSDRLKRLRNLHIDSTGQYALMTLNTFNEGHLRTFFRRSFKKLRKHNIPNLIIDLRDNGGGRVSWSTLLTAYVSRQSFKVADSVFAKSNTFAPFNRYFSHSFFNRLDLLLITHKKRDGFYHARTMERRIHKPKKKNHYNGNVYLLINGPTFSAASLFAGAVKGQTGIKLVGEETGGGWYGNNGIVIPDITLPHTKLKVRIPLFRVVQYRHQVTKKGMGVPPDIYIPTHYESLIKGVDYKMEVLKKIIYGRGEDEIKN